MSEMEQPMLPDQQDAVLVNEEAERAVLGGVLVSPEILGEVMALLRPDDFAISRHRHIWQAMLDLQEKGLDIDVLTLAQTLDKQGRLQDIGGKAYLLQLMAEVPSPQYALAYARLVEEAALRRRLLETSKALAQIAHRKDAEIEDLMQASEQAIFHFLERRLGRDMQPLQGVITDLFEQLQELYQHKEPLIGIPTGFSKLDNLLRGLQRSDLILVAGRPGMGKTAFALNVARNAARRGYTVAIFSLEMSREQVAQRLLSQQARISSDIFRAPLRLREPEMWESITQAMAQLSEMNIYIDDTPGLTPVQLRVKCRRIMYEQGRLDLVVVDYLQLMTADKRFKSRVEEVSYLSRMLKLLARDLNVPILAAAQLSRAVEQRADRRPMLSDLRESGSLEMDSDVVMFLYRPVYNKQKQKSDVQQPTNGQPNDLKGKVMVLVEKHRNGPTGAVELFFEPAFSMFRDAVTVSIPPSYPASFNLPPGFAG